MIQAEHQIKEYLLGQLTEAEEEQFELRLLSDPDFAAEYDIVVNEITDDYVAGAFAGAELTKVEQHFFKSSRRRDQLRFALALRKRKSDDGKSTRRPYTRYLAIAATIILLAGGGFYLWRMRSSNAELERGLAALQSAFRNERPLEARLSNFNYAPFGSQRGGLPKVDYVQRDRAAILLGNAATDHESAASLHALGKFYLAERQFDKAIDQLNRALVLNERDARTHSDLGAAFLELGKQQVLTAEKGKEIQSNAQSLAHFNRAIELDGSLLEAYFNRALLYQYMMLPQEAAAGWQDYLQRDSTSTWSDEARRNLKALEENRQKNSRNVDESFKQFLEAESLHADDAAWNVIAQNYTPAGNEVTNRLIDSWLEPPTAQGAAAPIAAQSGLAYVAALTSARAGDRYPADLVRHYEHTSVKVRPLLAEARRHMRTAYARFTQSDFSGAIDEYHEARRTYQQAGDSIDVIFVDYRLAHCYIFLPNLDQAESALKLLAATCANNHYVWLLAQCLFGLAHVSADNSEYTKAVDYSTRGLTEFERVGDLNGTLKTLTQLADFNQAVNRTNQALEYLSRGLALACNAPVEPMQRWGILNQTGFSMSSMQMHPAALFYQREALDVALAMDRPLIISRSHGYVGAAFAAMQMYPAAINEATRAFETGERMPQSPGGMEIMANASLQLGDIRRQADDCHRAMADYDRSIQLYGTLNFHYYSYLAHKGKLLCYVAQADDQATGEELRKVLDLSESYRSKITDENQRNSFFDLEQSVYDLAISFDQGRMRNDTKSFDDAEESRARSLRDQVQRGPARPGIHNHRSGIFQAPFLSHAEIQKRMVPGAQILQYAVLEDRLVMWVVTRSKIQAAEAPIRAQVLNEKVRAYLAAVNTMPTSEASNSSEQAAELYRFLIAPAEPLLDKSKVLCIVPDKILNYLPFSALVSPATNRYLIEDYDLDRAPSSSIFVDLSEAAMPKAGQFDEHLLGVGNPRLNAAFSSLPDLPSAAREVQRISKLYKQPKILISEGATKRAIKAETEKADVVHLAMHYVVNGQSEMLSGFPLAAEPALSTGGKSDGFLPASEIYNLNLRHTRLVVLSACQTGIEKDYRGEGAMGAARLFLIAKVPTVVASLWRVDSEASMDLMTNFHQYRVRDTLTVTRALKQAQILMARGPDLRYQHPYYWAPFQAIGGLTAY